MKPGTIRVPGFIKFIMDSICFYTLFRTIKNLKHLDGRIGNTSAGAEDCGDTRLVKEVIILCTY